MYVCLNRGDVDPKSQQFFSLFMVSFKQSAEAAGRSLVSVLVDHVFLCIKDAGEFLYMLKLKISFIWLGSESDSLVS